MGASEVVGYFAVVTAAAAVPEAVEMAVAVNKGWDEVSQYSLYSAGLRPSSPLPLPQQSAPHQVEDHCTNSESVAAIMHEGYAVIRNAGSLAPQRERTWQRKIEVAVVGPVGLVGGDQASRNDQSRWHAVTSRRQNGHPIVTLMRLEMAALRKEKSLENTNKSRVAHSQVT